MASASQPEFGDSSSSRQILDQGSHCHLFHLQQKSSNHCQRNFILCCQHALGDTWILPKHLRLSGAYVHGYFILTLMAFCVSLVTSTHLRGMAPDVQMYSCQGLHTEAFLLRASSQEVIFSKQLNKIWMLNRQGGVYVLSSALCIHTYIYMFMQACIYGHI